MRSLPLIVLLLAIAGCAPALYDLPPALTETDDGTVWFRGPGKLVMSGDLTLPDGEGRVPAVILMHGCAGLPHRAIDGWKPLLRDWGYATFVVDSFGPRGYREVCTNGAVSSIQRVPDAYGALAILSTHPRIDPDRIVLMGFSHGGLVANAAATDWARKFAREPEHRFRAIFSFYPSCVGRVEARLRLVVPLRIHTGEKDDWTPAAPCVENMARYRADGADVVVTVYPGAPHGFDAVGAALTYMPNVLNGSACRVVLTSIDDAPNGADLGCIKRGATSGYHGGAAADARRTVRAQLTELLARSAQGFGGPPRPIITPAWRLHPEE
jgi:dienelactone hydrolase